ncbi:hypothetical protein ACFO4L_17175 [Bacillus daqingensis]|uniref:Uncharacterized protein n=1 Tax=Bacillus daqingensis TaxID=872396 RepID=A0ABV9P2F6_9BACI
MLGHIPISPLEPKKPKRKFPKLIAAFFTVTALAGGVYYVGW